MKKEDTIALGPFKYKVIETYGNWMLLAWIESGIEKQLWVNYKRKVA